MFDFMNVPEVKLGLVVVSRDCFLAELSQKRKAAVLAEAAKQGLHIEDIDVILENENDAMKALEELKKKGCNALVLYLGNFGPEVPETLLLKKFDGVSMIVAAAEETQKNLFDDRGDAYCGMLNASYACGIRGIKPYIPKYPVGVPCEVVNMVKEFEDVARVMIGVRGLKIFGFGPRPHDFLACNAPIKPLFDLGVEIQENSELDLYSAYKAHNGDERIPSVVKEMEKELGQGNTYPDLLTKLAQYELTLLDWAKDNLGASTSFAFANKCWPAFQTEFGFVPCYVNSRLMQKGIPVACETDIYGALSEYMMVCASMMPATLLDINNTVPKDMFDDNAQKLSGYKHNDTFMGFHCGNTPSCCMAQCEMKHQLIMKRNLEPDSEPNVSRGTLEGNLIPGETTLFRLQSSADCILKSYVAEGEIIDIDCKSFGSIGAFAIHEMDRFYRYVLIEGRYPHHSSVGFKKVGRILFDAVKLLGVQEVKYNLPAGTMYDGENPF